MAENYNIFTYRPSLQYVYERINTIREALGDEETDIIIDFLPSTNVGIIQDYLDLRDSFKQFYNNYYNKIKHLTIPYRLTIPPHFEQVLHSHKDWDKINNNKEVTLDFIQDIKDKPLFSEINYNIQEEIKGTNGNIQFEIYDMLEKTDFLLNYYQKGLDKTLFLWYNTSENSDISDNLLKESLLNIEEYLKYYHEREEAITKQDNKGVIEATKKMEYLNKKINSTNNIMYVTKQINSILFFLERETNDTVETDSLNEHNLYTAQRVSELYKNEDFDNKAVKTLLYTSFKGHKKNLESLDSENFSTLSKGNIKSEINEFFKNSKYYLDIYSTTINNLKNNSYSNQYGYLNSLYDGLTYMENNYQNSMVEFSTFLSKYFSYLSSYTSELYAKNDSRALFNAFKNLG